METMQAEHVADGQQPITSADVVCKVLCVHQGKAPSQESGNNLFLKNASIQMWQNLLRNQAHVHLLMSQQTSDRVHKFPTT